MYKLPNLFIIRFSYVNIVHDFAVNSPNYINKIIFNLNKPLCKVFYSIEFKGMISAIKQFNYRICILCLSIWR